MFRLRHVFLYFALYRASRKQKPDNYPEVFQLIYKRIS
jgi:hypothetical protein